MKLKNSNDTGQGRIYSTAYKYNMYIYILGSVRSVYGCGVESSTI